MVKWQAAFAAAEASGAKLEASLVEGLLVELK